MKIITCLLFSFLFGTSFAQELSAEFIERFEISAERYVGVDDFDNLYYVNGNILYKKTPSKLFSYSNVALGTLEKVDMSNPFKVILFYPDFNAVILLDNNLNELTERIDFTDETKFNNVRFVTGSSQNNLWLFADDNRLHLYDYLRHRDMLETQPLTFYEPEFQAKKLVSVYKKVWILSNQAVFEFNEYGTFINKFILPQVEDIFPFQKGFLYISGGSFYYQLPENSMPIDLQIEHPISSVSVNSTNIYIFDGRRVNQYQIIR